MKVHLHTHTKEHKETMEGGGSPNNTMLGYTQAHHRAQWQAEIQIKDSGEGNTLSGPLPGLPQGTLKHQCPGMKPMTMTNQEQGSRSSLALSGIWSLEVGHMMGYRGGAF